MKKHIISLYTLVVILLASQVFMMYSFIIKTDQLSDSINQTASKLGEFQILTQGQINELTKNLIETQSSLKEQIDEIKSTTSSDFSGIIENSVQSVVSVATDVAQGSGFIISNDGLIVTNAHVLSGGRIIKILTYNREILSASLVGYNLDMDIAVIKAEGNFEYLKFGNSDKIKVGEKVIAVGNPLGLSFTVTEGIISATDRTGPNGKPYYIQTDVPLNPGNSGGPLINKEGKVIGVTNFKIGGFENLGFALESNKAEEAINGVLAAANQA